MKLDILTALNAERAARRAAVVVTNVESGKQRLVKADQGSGVVKIRGFQLPEQLENVALFKRSRWVAEGFQFGKSMIEGFRGNRHSYTSVLYRAHEKYEGDDQESRCIPSADEPESPMYHAIISIRLKVLRRG